MRINELREQSGNKKQCLRVHELDEQTLDKETAMSRQRHRRRCRFRKGASKCGNDDARSKVKQIKSASDTKERKDSRSSGQQCAQPKRNTDEKYSIANLDTGYANETGTEPVASGLGHRAHHGWPRCQCDNRPGYEIKQEGLYRHIICDLWRPTHRTLFGTGDLRQKKPPERNLRKSSQSSKEK